MQGKRSGCMIRSIMKAFRPVVADTSVAIPGVRRPHTFLQLGDMHLAVADAMSGDEERNEAEKRTAQWMSGRNYFADKFGESCANVEGVPPADIFEGFLKFAKVEKPDALLFSGDILDYQHEAGMRLLRERRAASASPWLFAPGNHESETREGLWNGMPAVMEFDGFRIVAFDNSRKTVSNPALDSLEALLAGTTPTILLYHVPLVTDGNRAALARLDPYFYIEDATADENARRLLGLVTTSPSVALCLCGHVHFFSDTWLTPSLRQITCSQGLAGSFLRLTVGRG